MAKEVVPEPIRKVGTPANADTLPPILSPRITSRTPLFLPGGTRIQKTDVPTPGFGLQRPPGGWLCQPNIANILGRWQSRPRIGGRGPFDHFSGSKLLSCGLERRVCSLRAVEAPKMQNAGFVWRAVCEMQHLYSGSSLHSRIRSRVLLCGRTPLGDRLVGTHLTAALA